MGINKHHTKVSRQKLTSPGVGAAAGEADGGWSSDSDGR